jgi:hypothetical protein
MYGTVFIEDGVLKVIANKDCNICINLPTHTSCIEKRRDKNYGEYYSHYYLLALC